MITSEYSPFVLDLCQLVTGRWSDELIVETDWEKAVEVGLQQNLGSLLFHELSQQPAVKLPSDLSHRLAVEARQAAVRYSLLKATQEHISTVLTAKGIPCLWLKGIVLARTVYPEPWLRPMVDLDVLVPYERREEALKVLQTAGYCFYQDDDVPAFVPMDIHLTHLLSHHYVLQGGPTGAVTVELHYELLGGNESILARDRLAWFWEQSRVNAAGLRVLNPEAQLLYLCAHTLLQHGETDFRLLRYLDCHLLIKTFFLDWDTLVRQAVMLGWTYVVERVLHTTVSLFGTDVPSDVFVRLQAKRPAGENVNFINSLQQPGADWAKIVRRMRHLSMGSRLWLTCRILLPPRDYMRWRYHVHPDQPIWTYYPYRWFSQAQRIGQWAWHRLNNRMRVQPR